MRRERLRVLEKQSLILNEAEAKDQRTWNEGGMSGKMRRIRVLSIAGDVLVS